jgi:hypothetical protein
MEAPSYFRDFLSKIRLTQSQVDNAKTGHGALRKRLSDDSDLTDVVVTTFLQGSYRRKTGVKPKGDKRADVDIIVVTNINADETTPAEAIERFIPFVKEHYAGKYTRAGRSIQIELSYVDLDLVVTAAPSEAASDLIKALGEVDMYGPDDTMLMETMNETFSKFAAEEPQWKNEPLLIPDRDAGDWKRTHPLRQIEWTTEKNSLCNDHYINVVKAVKWWRLVNYPDHKHPKGYPLEHVVGDCCPDGITSVAGGFTLALEEVSSRYAGYVEAGQVPWLSDRGVPEHNVLARTTKEEFAAFHEQAKVAAELAREALDEQDLTKSVGLWRELFGSEFPAPPDDNGKGASGAFTKREKVSDVGGARWA